MTTMEELFATWRTQIEAELADAKVQLAKTHEAQHKAVQASREATARHAALIAAINTLPRPAGALLFRVQGYTRDLSMVQAPVSRHRAVIKEMMAQIEDMENALAQISDLARRLPVTERVASLTA